MSDQKLAKVGQIRKMQAKAKCGSLILQMVDRKVEKISGIESLRKRMGMGFDAFKRNMGAMVVVEGKNSCVLLTPGRVKVVERTRKVFSEFKEYSDDDKKIAQNVFLALMSNGG